tara:strand:- start:80 stop:232 length:153 start_codon:yes stop_codon:yes gene_type:complete
MDIDEYLKDASEKIITNNVNKKIIFLFLEYLKLFFGTNIKKQHNKAIIGI